MLVAMALVPVSATDDGLVGARRPTSVQPAIADTASRTGPAKRMNLVTKSLRANAMMSGWKAKYTAGLLGSELAIR
jgi:hypothetical protein